MLLPLKLAGPVQWTEYCGDAELVRQIPWADKYLGQPLLLLIEAIRPTLANGQQHG